MKRWLLRLQAFARKQVATSAASNFKASSKRPPRPLNADLRPSSKLSGHHNHRLKLRVYPVSTACTRDPAGTHTKDDFLCPSAFHFFPKNFIDRYRLILPFDPCFSVASNGKLFSHRLERALAN